MRKHFLILMLLTLLPLAGFAEDYFIYPQDIDKTYGSNDPAVNASMFTARKASDNSWVSDRTGIAANLEFVRLTAGEDVNSSGYSYRLKVSSTYTGTDTYYIQGEAKLYINPFPLNTVAATNKELTLINQQRYIDADTKVKPALADFTVLVKGFEINPANRTLANDGSDYTITGYGGDDDNKVVGTGKVTITGKGNFTGAMDLTFPIIGIDLTTYTPTVTALTTGFTYDGNPKAVSTITWKKGTTSVALTKDYDYTIGTYTKNTNAGTATVQLTGTGNYEGTVNATFTINPYTVPADGLTIDKVNPMYNGKKLLPSIGAGGIKVTANNLSLAPTDYEITTESVNAGSATATLKFKSNGNFTGSDYNIDYTILKRPINQGVAGSVYIAQNLTAKTYTGSPILTNYKLKVENSTTAYLLQEGSNKDFTVIVDDNVNVGTAKIKFVAVPTGNFEGETDFYNYPISPATLKIYPNDITTSYGSTITPSFVVEGWKTDADRTAGYTVTSSVTYKYTGIGGTTYAESSTIPTAVGTYSIAIDNFSGLNAGANYNFAKKTGTSGEVKGTLTITAGELVLAAESQEKEYGETPDAYNLEYVSGLSASAAETFNASTALNHGVTNVTYEVRNADGDDVTTAAAAGTLAKGTYTIKAVKVDATQPFVYNGYNVIISDGTLTINPRDINDVDVVIVDPTFDGTAKEPALTVTLGGANVVDGTTGYIPYTAVYSNNTDATIDAEAVAAAQIAALPALPATSTAEETAARNAEIFAILSQAKAKVVLTAKAASNFTGTKEVLFSINKKDLRITADPGEWTYGNTEPTDWTATVNIDDLVATDKSTNFSNASSLAAHKFSGELKVKRSAATGDTAGEYFDNSPLIAENKLGLIPTGLSAKNYTIVANAGKLTINKGNLVLKVKDFNQPYGEGYNAGDFSLEYYGGLTDPAKQANWAEVVNTTGVTYQAINATDGTTVILPADVPITVGSTVKLKATGATSTNYNITYEMGTYTVVKRPIAFMVSNQTIAFGADIVRTDAKVALVGGYTFKDGDDIAHLIASGNLQFVIADDAEKNAGATTADVIKVTLTHEKYVLDEENSSWGDLTVGDALALVLDPADATLAEKLETTFDGVSNVTVKFGKRELKANTWYTMVLPFDITTSELVATLKGHIDDVDVNDNPVRTYGTNSVYAIVNRLGASTANQVNFKLEMLSIPANEPFLIKTAEDVDLVNPNISFVNKTIVYSAEPKAEAAGVEYGGNEFLGTYTAIAAADLNYNTTDRHFAFLGNSSYTGSKGQALSNTWYNATLAGLVINPMEAYLHYSPDKGSAAAPIITIEDYDFENGTTAIKTLNVETMKAYAAEGWYTLDGIKLQNVPTEKGVYINNGKKVVIK